MSKGKGNNFDGVTDKSSTQERVTIERIFDKAVAFYKESENLQAFQAWKKSKEELWHKSH